jgi:hypothetical protein
MTTHHPFGPSIVYAIKKCGALVPAEGDSQMAEAGSLRHEVFGSGDFLALGGDEQAVQTVKMARAYVDELCARYGFNGKVFHEVTLELPGVNFGTCDYLKFNSDGTEALLLDLKFGAWSVKAARSNLQLLNYAAAAFETYPHLRRILGVIWQVGGRVSTRWFNRQYLPRYTQTIRSIVERAMRIRANPQPGDFHPDPVNCSFCARVNCPARVQLASALVSAWAKTPVTICRPFSLTRIDLDTLTALKRLCGALNTFTDAVNNEAKRRVFDEGVAIPGYEIRERSGKRTLTGEAKVETAIALLGEFWRERYPEIPLDIPNIILGIVELSVGEIEKNIARHAPRGQSLLVQKAVAEVLEKAGLIEAVPQFFLAAVKT